MMILGWAWVGRKHEGRPMVWETREVRQPASSSLPTTDDKAALGPTAVYAPTCAWSLKRRNPIPSPSLPPAPALRTTKATPQPRPPHSVPWCMPGPLAASSGSPYPPKRLPALISTAATAPSPSHARQLGHSQPQEL
jgi:hypothetical protein